MARYSTQPEIKDELIKQYSKNSDHVEAEEYIDKVLSKLGIDPAGIEITPLLKNLSITFATYKRAFYESRVKDDIFYQKYLSYEKDLRSLTADLIRKSTEEDDDGGNADSKIFTETFRS